MQECEDGAAYCPVTLQMFPGECKEVGEYMYLKEWQSISKSDEEIQIT